MLNRRWLWLAVVVLVAAPILRSHVGDKAIQPREVTVADLATFPGPGSIRLPTRIGPARVDSDIRESTGSSARVERRLDAAWQDTGCQINPGNPGCLVIMQAADCALSSTDPGCDADSDGDGCRDVAEVQFGFDPFAPADCVGGSRGAPAINCLFPRLDRPCSGDGLLASPAPFGCGAEPRDRPCDSFGTGHK